MSHTTNFYLGIMSGTSVDGIDIALVKQDGIRTMFVAGAEYEYDPYLRQNILTLCQEKATSLQFLGELTQKLSLAYADAVNTFLSENMLSAQDIVAIGCHGQTVYHQPTGNNPFSMQLINASVISANTGITMISDFRSMDIALGGQGAPLVPLFHQSLIENIEASKALVFLNLGGIANISIVNPLPLKGFDTGPANVLLDAWILKVTGEYYDKNGALALSGQCNHEFLAYLLQEPYFSLPAPKSSGRELFNLAWLEQKLAQFRQPVSNSDIMATLVQLTCQPIVEAIKHLCPGKLLVCGGGVKNKAIMQCLIKHLPQWYVSATDDEGISSNFMEAMAFAWLAYRCLNRLPGNHPQVTGASRPEICGSITRVIEHNHHFNPHK